MGTIKTSIIMNDGMTPALRSMSRALGIVLNTLESVQTASGKAIDTTSIKNAKNEIANANAILNQTEEQIKQVRNEANKMPSDFKKTNNVLDQMREKMQKTASSAGNIAKGILGASIIQSTLGAIKGQLDAAISRYDTLNNYTKVMSNLGIDEASANASKQRLASGLKGLPTTLDDAVISVQKFTSANGNIKASTEMFLALNNAILAGGASTQIQQTALEQLSQAYAKGKPDMMEWRALQTAMPAQLNQIAKAMNTTSTELGEDLRTGKISMNEFMETVVNLNQEGIDGFKSFEEQAKNSTGGIQTAIANMKSAIGRGWASMIENANNALQASGLPTISEIITNMGAAIEDAMGKIGNDLLPSLGKALADLGTQFNAFAKTTIGSANSSLNAWDYFIIGFNTVKLGFMSALGYMQLGMIGVKMVGLSVVIALLETFDKLATGVQTVIWAVANNAQSFVNKIIGLINTLIDGFNGAVDGLNAAFGWLGFHGEHAERVKEATFADDYMEHVKQSMGDRQIVINDRKNELVAEIDNAATISSQLKEYQKNSANELYDDIIRRKNKTIEEATNGAGATSPNNWGDLINNVASIDDSAGNISDKLDATEEDLKYLRDLAERDVINRFTTAEIKLDFTSNNNISSDMDLDGVIERITEKIHDAVITSAEEVHA